MLAHLLGIFKTYVAVMGVLVTEHHFWLNFSEFSGTLRKREFILTQLERVSLTRHAKSHSSVFNTGTRIELN